MQPLLTCEEMRAADRAAIAAGIPGRVLMENAASAALGHILAEGPEQVFVLCGKGNNGGDGFAVARRLCILGVPCRILSLCAPNALSGDALENYRTALALDVPVLPFETTIEVPAGTVLVDALLGTGVRGDVEGIWAAAIRWMNASGAPIISLDIPSGICGDTGRVCGCAVKAKKTVTFGAGKLGLYSPLSIDFVGEVCVEDISIPIQNGSRFLIEKTDIKPPSLSAAAHKGKRGHGVLLCGSTGFSGAAALATMAAEFGGAGLVTAMVPRSILPSMMAKLLGAMCKENAAEIPEKANALLVGCGIGRDAEGQAVFEKAMRANVETILIDADGLYHLKDNMEGLQKTKATVVLTPHIGEMAHLCGISPETVVEKRVEISERFAKTHGVTVVLKGAGTVVAKPDGTTYINMTGNAGMARGGSGDILAGLMLGFAASGWENFAAAAVFVHGLAGDMAAKCFGKYALTAQSLVNFLPEAIKCM